MLVIDVNMDGDAAQRRSPTNNLLPLNQLFTAKWDVIEDNPGAKAYWHISWERASAPLSREAVHRHRYSQWWLNSAEMRLRIERLSRRGSQEESSPESSRLATTMKSTTMRRTFGAYGVCCLLLFRPVRANIYVPGDVHARRVRKITVAMAGGVLLEAAEIAAQQLVFGDARMASGPSSLIKIPVSRAGSRRRKPASAIGEGPLCWRRGIGDRQIFLPGVVNRRAWPGV